MKKNYKKIILILIVVMIISIIITYAIKRKIRNNTIENREEITSIEDFDTIEKVAKYLNCEFIKETKSADKDFSKDVYMKIRYKVIEDGKTNETFYRKLITYASKALQHDNYRIIDSDQDITISVYCDKKQEKIKRYLINGISDYFERLETKENASNLEKTPITNLSINSQLLNDLINSKWVSNDRKIGTEESTFDNYKIFFDEGIKLRRVDGKIYNIIFTEKYRNKVVNDIGTGVSNEDIIKVLGQPTFEDEVEEIIGYKGNEIYAFFSDGEISVYRANNNEYLENVEEIINNYIEDKDFNKLIQDMQEKVPDYNSKGQYGKNLDINYCLKGIKISTMEGIVIYKNYIGKIFDGIDLNDIANNTENIPYKINVEDEDFVFLEESRRKNEISSKIFNSAYYYDETANIDVVADERKYNDSKMFCMNKKQINEKFLLEVISLDKKNPDSELTESMDWAIWINDYKILYGIKNRGIYVYNAIDRKYNVIIEDTKSEFKFIEYENNILKYDNKEIGVK